MGNLPQGRHDFDAIDLVPRRSITDGPIAAGIGRGIAPDKAGVPAAGVAGIEQSLGFGGGLYVSRADARFDDHVQFFPVHFEDAVHLFCAEDDTAVGIDDSAKFQACPGSPGNDGDIFRIGQLQDSRHIFSRRRIHYGIGRTEKFPFHPFIPFVLDEAVRIGGNALFSQYIH